MDITQRSHDAEHDFTVELDFINENGDALSEKYGDRILLMHDGGVAGDYNSFDLAHAEGVTEFGEGNFILYQCRPPMELQEHHIIVIEW